MLAAAMLVAMPIASPAGAQQPPAPVPGVIDPTASMGTVTINKQPSLGWIAGPGIVVTTNRYAAQVGTSATFTRLRTEQSTGCYVAVVAPERLLSVLRCVRLPAADLDLDLRYPAPGTPATVTAVTSVVEDQIQVSSQTGALMSNDFRFMGSNQLQFSFGTSGDGLLGENNFEGAPVTTAEGKVISTLMVAPADGGPALGTTPAQLSKIVNQAVGRPESFAEAAILSVLTRSWIPALVGLGLGLAWGAYSRNRTLLQKAFAGMFIGVFGAVAYSLFTLVVTGPETLIN